MGTKNSLSSQESWHLPPLLVSRGKVSRALPARLLFPAFFSNSFLFFSPFSHFTYLQPDGLLTDKNEVSCSTDAATSPLSNFNISKRYGVLSTSLRDYRTALAWNQLQQRERRWQRAHRRRPTVLETQEKKTETEAHSPSPTVHACKVSGCRVPVKI